MMKKRSICLLLLLALVVSLVGCGSEKPKPNNDAKTQNVQTQDTENSETSFYSTDEDCFTIETKYGTLEYPVKWKKVTKTEIADEPYAVKFCCVTSAGNIPLFELNFGSDEGFLLGTLSKDGKSVPVYLNSFDIDKTALSEEEYINCCAMEEDVNVIISRLVEKNSMVLPGNEPISNLPEDNGKVYAIETKFGKLSYPEKWKELAKIEIVEAPVYMVKFSTETASGKIPLVDLTFNGGDGYLLGTMKVDGKDIAIRIDDYALDQSTLNEKDYFNCCAMQEDVNVILEHLVEDYGFTFD